MDVYLQKVISNGAASTTFSFKVRQALFQSGAETVISKRVNVYFKVGQALFQSGAVTSKWGKILFQSRKIIWSIKPFKLLLNIRIILFSNKVQLFQKQHFLNYFVKNVNNKRNTK